MGLSGMSLLSATGQQFAVPTPPFADGSWDMYQDFVGGVQFWGYALASGSGDGAVRMWDSECGVPAHASVSVSDADCVQCARARSTGR
jgi:division protein 1